MRKADNSVMCGIYGIVGAPRAQDASMALAMDQCLIHRGPDDSGMHLSPLGVLGMRRLAIIDLVTGSQPMASPDNRIWLTLNGEIYNFRELRDELAADGRRFVTTSDTEVALAAYERFGDAFVTRLHGMFAIAVFDEARNRVVLARDRLGKKPLYYSERAGRFTYASELKALKLDREFDATIDRDALWHYLTFKNVPAPLSIFRGARQLPAGHIAIIENGTLRLQEYWRPKFTGDARLDEDEAADAIIERLRKATRARMEASDVPIAAFLSGGVDSSLVVALMAEHSTIPVKTFSLGYTERVAHKNDLGFAREMAQRFGTDHHEREISPETMIDDLPKVVRAFDEPFAGTISPYWLCGEISREVKVALSGDGADELFGSYKNHRLAAVVANVRAGRTSPADLGEWADRPEIPQTAAREPDWVWRAKLAAFDDAEKRELLAETIPAQPSAMWLERFYRDAPHDDTVNATLEVEMRTLLPDQILTYVDRLSMAHSLEVRSPYLDTSLVELVGTLPGSMKVRPGASKAILKRAARRFLPDAVVDRPKEGFVLPVDAWLVDRLQGLTDDLFSAEALGRHGMFQRAPILRLVREHRERVADHTYKLWTLLMFQLWHHVVVAGSESIPCVKEVA
ncbi:MAG: asparagine synthase (glutamine-hydrolyzing) [Candidatus Eremiobacteraeota bacterium]|nr:asparagine synthase (glutamine-hydrolyzing) [Candidatus Eremiobacteraeota bacterium]